MISPHDKVSLRAMLERILAKSTKQDKERIIGFVMGILEFFPQETKCQDCRSFDMGKCKKWNDTIPPEFQKDGCEHWLFNESSPPF